jgi:hypothetical protein
VQRLGRLQQDQRGEADRRRHMNNRSQMAALFY